MVCQPRQIAFVLGLVSVLGGCNTSSHPTSPTLPSVVAATFTLTGTVTAAAEAGGVPVAGAHVQIDSQPGVCPGCWRPSAITDEHGFYRILAVPAGSWALTASKYGYVTRSRNVTVTGDAQMDIQLDRGGVYTLSGVVSEVTSAGEVPVEDVWVYCDSCGHDGHTGVYTDSRGYYIFPEVLPGSTPLVIHKDGYDVVDPVPGFANKVVTVNGDTRFDIRLVRR